MQLYEGTASAGFFADSANQLAQRLSGDTSTRAEELRATANRLSALFREWTNRRPPDDERVTAIRTLFEHNRRVLDYLAKAGKGDAASPAPRAAATQKK